ncbi:MAG: hypothetical protein ABSG16_23155 [Candidatus Acidiferrum sp.]|jgi:hypothetical protein
MAKEEEAAIGFSGRVSRNGLLPSPGPVTRIVEAVRDRARSAGLAPRGAGFSGAPLKDPAALGEYTGRELAGGGAFRAMIPTGPLLSGRVSGSS